MQRYAVWFGGSMLASTVKISIHNLFCQIYLFFIHKLWGRIWKDILKNTLCICSLTFIKCATQKRNTTNMVPQFAATIRCLERWRKKNNFLAIFCFHFDYIFSKRKKAFVFAFWFIYITVIKEKNTNSVWNSIRYWCNWPWILKTKKIKTNRPIFKKIAQFNLNIVRQLMMMHFDPNWCSWKIDQLLLTHWSKIIQKNNYSYLKTTLLP